MKVFLIILMIGAIGLFIYELVAFALDLVKKAKARKQKKIDEKNKMNNSAE